MLNSMKNFITSPSSQLLTKIGIVGFALYATFNYKATDNKERILHKSAFSTAEIVATENKAIALPPVKRKPQVNVEYAQIKQNESVIKPHTKPLGIAQAENKQELNKVAIHTQSINTLNMGYPILEHFKRSSNFGPRHGTAHNGVDIATRVGTPVRAPSNSQVAYNGWASGYGRTVILYHGSNVYTLYAHLKNGSTTSLRKGQNIDKGQVFAKAGATGDVRGAHLHTEVIIADDSSNKGYVVDPQRVWNNADIGDIKTRNALIEDAEKTMGRRIGVKSKVFTARIVNAGYSPDSFDNHLNNTQVANIRSASLNLN